MTALPAAPPGTARIGPNAVLQTCAELAQRYGRTRTDSLVREAGLAAVLAATEPGMVEEQAVQRLFLMVERAFPHDAPSILAASGERTAGYLLRHRIPRPAQALLRALPAAGAAPLLLRAIERNAWTFAGSGRFHTERHPGGARLGLERCPLCRGVQAREPRCHFYTGTFRGLATHLLSPSAQVREVACESCGDDRCAWEVRWA